MSIDKINIGSSTASVKQAISDIIGYYYGPTEAVGLNWLTATQKLNNIASDLGEDAITHLLGGVASRENLNALIDGIGLPDADLYLDFVNGRYWDNGPASESLIQSIHSTDILIPDETGVYQTIAPNVLARNDLGLWSIPNRTNYVAASENYATGWLSGTSGGSLPTVAGSGTLFGIPSAIIDCPSDGVSNFRYLLVSGLTPETQYRASFFARLLTTTGLTFAIYDATNAAWIIQPLAGNASNVTDQLVDGEGRVTQTFTTPAGCTSVRIYPIDRRVGGVPGTAGQTEIAGFQIEAGEFATPYIKTTGAAAARSANRNFITVPDGPRAFAMEIDLLEPVVGSNSRHLAAWSAGASANRWVLLINAAGTLSLASISGGSQLGESTGSGALTLGRNYVYGVVADGYIRRGVVGSGDGNVGTPAAPAEPISMLGLGGPGYEASFTTYMRLRNMIEVREITDAAAAYDEVKVIAEGWAA